MGDSLVLDKLIDCFKALPGVGTKTAQRYAYYCLEHYSASDIERLTNQLNESFKKIHKCPICGMYTESDLCEICSSPLRDKTKIMVVKDVKDLITIESSHQYNGLYHVLGGLISPIEGITPDKLNLKKLTSRIVKETVEVVLAIKLTPQGDVTSLYIEKMLDNFPIKISRIGYGLPAGSDLEYADEVTIKRALDYRVQTK